MKKLSFVLALIMHMFLIGTANAFPEDSYIVVDHVRSWSDSGPLAEAWVYSEPEQGVKHVRLLRFFCSIKNKSVLEYHIHDGKQLQSYYSYSIKPVVSEEMRYLKNESELNSDVEKEAFDKACTVNM